MIDILLFLAIGVGMQSTVPTSMGIQQTDTHGPCVGDSCGHNYQYVTTPGVKPEQPKHTVKYSPDPYIDDAGCLHERNGISCYMPDSPWAKASCWSIDAGYICPSIPWYTTKDHSVKDELPDLTKLDLCMIDHGPYGCEEFGGPPRDNSYSYKNCVMANGSVWIQKDCGVDPIAPVVSNGAITVDGGDGSKVIKITDEEYSHLQEIRQAVGDEEKRLAAKYGANLDDYAFQTFPSLSTYPEAIHHADHFEFHGRFLIIDKSK